MYLNLPETLKEIDRLIRERDKLARDISRAKWQSLPSGGGAMQMDGMPRGSPPRPCPSAAMEALQAMLERREAIDAKLRFLSGELRPLIAALPAGTDQRVLMARYVDCLSMGMVSATLPYSRTELYRAIDRARLRLLNQFKPG